MTDVSNEPRTSETNLPDSTAGQASDVSLRATAPKRLNKASQSACNPSKRLKISKTKSTAAGNKPQKTKTKLLEGTRDNPLHKDYNSATQTANIDREEYPEGSEEFKIERKRLLECLYRARSDWRKKNPQKFDEITDDECIDHLKSQDNNGHQPTTKFPEGSTDVVIGGMTTSLTPAPESSRSSMHDDDRANVAYGKNNTKAWLDGQWQKIDQKSSLSYNDKLQEYFDIKRNWRLRRGAQAKKVEAAEKVAGKEARDDEPGQADQNSPAETPPATTSTTNDSGSLSKSSPTLLQVYY